MTEGMIYKRVVGKIYIITSKTSVCYGHGDYGAEITLVTEPYGSKKHPAFVSEEAAEIYRKNIDEYDHYEITELELMA